MTTRLLTLGTALALLGCAAPETPADTPPAADTAGLPVAARSTPADSADTRVLAPDVRVTRLAPGLWMHTTDDPASGYPSNGMLLETDSGTVLFDTAWDDRQTVVLLEWAARELAHPVRRAVITHGHGDRLGGLGTLRAAGVPATALGATVRQARAAGGAVPDSLPGLAHSPRADAAGFELFYPGAGHTADNVVAYFPAARVLFGGCLVKSDTATTVGNVADADVAEWPRTVARVRERYDGARVVVPGHGAVSGPEALTVTEALIAEKGPAARAALRARQEARGGP
ncbi:MAG TPA: subclass B1 metallo-beta-lactamase [Gemmatimonadaceae bacterium]|nr:subclass B1 metallo-beta-lactamase [Gemmatimonadaceae bacterium]